jgi:SPP1 gp7 family putative phage head morphogenesis protein
MLTTVYSQHTVYLQRIGATQGNAVVPYLKLIEEDIQRIFNKYRDRAKTAANQVAIQEAINKSSRKHLQDYIVDLKKSNREIGLNEAEFAGDTLNKVVVNDDFESIVPSAAQVNAIAIATPIQLSESAYTTYNSMMSNYWLKWSDEVDALVQNGFVNGSTINEISTNIFNQMRLEKSTASKNTLNRAHRAAKSVAITGTNHYANTARIEFVDQNDDMLKGYRLIAVVDSRTSQKCRALDQKFIPKDSPKLSSFTPPLHINCRTALVYEVDDKYKLDDKDTKRASSFEVDGKRDPKPVSSEGIYYDKMKDLNKDDQDNILGPTLGKAFRKMDNPAEFANATIDSLGNPLTLAEMKKKDNKLGSILRADSSTTKTASKKSVKKAAKAESNIKTINKTSKAKKPEGKKEVASSTAGVIKKKQPGRTTISSGITSDESAYLEYYKGEGFAKNNDILRNPSKYSSQEVASANSMLDSLDSAISKSTLDSDTLLYRGIRDKELFSGIDTSAIGTTIPISTAQSFTKDGRMSLTYSGAIKLGDEYVSAGSEAVIFRLKAKAGQKALDMERLTGIGNTSEAEMLLSSKGAYKIVGVEEKYAPDGSVSMKILDVEYEEGG